MYASAMTRALLFALVFFSLIGCSKDCPDGGDPDSYLCSELATGGQQDGGVRPDGGQSDGGLRPDAGGQCQPTAASESGAELCDNGEDDDCDGDRDEDDADCNNRCEDRDEDGWCPIGPDRDHDGDCCDDNDSENPSEPGDCDDHDRWRRPGLPEICDGGLDNDCNPQTVETESTGACRSAVANQCHVQKRGEGQHATAYLFCFAPRNWESAQRVCDESGMRLTRIDDRDENDWIWTTFDAKNVSKTTYWIGASDRQQEGHWQTEAGFYRPREALPYANWLSGQPDDRDGEDCVQVYYREGGVPDRKWNDDECFDSQNFVCERY